MLFSSPCSGHTKSGCDHERPQSLDVRANPAMLLHQTRQIQKPLQARSFKHCIFVIEFNKHLRHVGFHL
jgi:hypothetical protein